MEDDRSIGPLLERVLQHNGLDTIVADSGEKGLALLGEQAFTVVVLDLMMSGVNGWDVIRKIVRDFPNLSVVLATAVSPTQPGHLDPSVVKTVDKPFDINQVSNAVRLSCYGQNP